MYAVQSLLELVVPRIFENEVGFFLLAFLDFFFGSCESDGLIDQALELCFKVFDVVVDCLGS
jgi:hypothetical protein